jgi:hypothetical protein
VLHGNFRLPCANLLKAERLKKKSRHRLAVQQPQVSAGELVDFKAALIGCESRYFLDPRTRHAPGD